MEVTSVLFVCSGPGVRGRIAEAYLKHIAPVQFKVDSAQFEEREGTLPQFIVQLMREEGLSVETTFPKSVFARYLDKEGYDYVITLCSASTNVVCPIFKSNVKALYQEDAERLSWSILDFRSLSKLEEADRMDGARSIRDTIKEHIESFVSMVNSSKIRQ